MVFHMVKKRLTNGNGTWAEELPVWWVYWTTVWALIGETPFAMTYGCEFVILLEVDMPNYGVRHYKEITNNEGLEVSLDLLEEKMKEVDIRVPTYRGRIEQ